MSVTLERLLRENAALRRDVRRLEAELAEVDKRAESEAARRKRHRVEGQVRVAVGRRLAESDPRYFRRDREGAARLQAIVDEIFGGGS